MMQSIFFFTSGYLCLTSDAPSKRLSWHKAHEEYLNLPKTRTSSASGHRIINDVHATRTIKVTPIYLAPEKGGPDLVESIAAEARKDGDTLGTPWSGVRTPFHPGSFAIFCDRLTSGAGQQDPGSTHWLPHLAWRISRPRSPRLFLFGLGAESSGRSFQAGGEAGVGRSCRAGCLACTQSQELTEQSHAANRLFSREPSSSWPSRSTQFSRARATCLTLSLPRMLRFTVAWQSLPNSRLHALTCGIGSRWFCSDTLSFQPFVAPVCPVRLISGRPCR